METATIAAMCLPPQFESWLNLYKAVKETHTVNDDAIVSYEYQRKSLDGTSAIRERYEWPLYLIKARAFDEIFNKLPSHNVMRSIVHQATTIAPYQVEWEGEIEKFMSILK